MSISIKLIALAATSLLAGAGLGPLQAAEPSQSMLIKQATVGRDAAAKTALARVPGGRIKSSELENEHGALVWSFDIAIPKSRNIQEILVNATTGVIIHSEIESPKDQAKELEEDRKQARLKS